MNVGVVARMSNISRYMNKARKKGWVSLCALTCGGSKSLGPVVFTSSFTKQNKLSKLGFS